MIQAGGAFNIKRIPWHRESPKRHHIFYPYSLFAAVLRKQKYLNSTQRINLPLAICPGNQCIADEFETTNLLLNAFAIAN